MKKKPIQIKPGTTLVYSDGLILYIIKAGQIYRIVTVKKDTILVILALQSSPSSSAYWDFLTLYNHRCPRRTGDVVSYFIHEVGDSYFIHDLELWELVA